MKALIVDDEKHVRDAIRLLVEWDAHGIDHIYEAADGTQAVELLSAHKPQIVMTDMMMPNMSGSALMEWISQHSPTSKLIAISGHDDFALVRHTMQHGGMDYILKPIDPDTINTAVAKAVAAWLQDEKERAARHQQRMQVNEFKPLLSEKLWSSLLDDPSVYEANMRRLELEFGLPAGIDEVRITVAVINVCHPTFRHKFGDNRQLLYYSLLNIANEIVNRGAQSRGAAFRYASAPNELVLVMWKQAEELEAVLQQVNEGLQQTMQRNLHFGVSEKVAFPAGMQDAYARAKAALAQRNLLERGSHIHAARELAAPEEAGASAASKAVRLSSYDEAWKLAVQSGHAEQLKSAVRRWVDAARSLQAVTPHMLQAWLKEWGALRMRIAQEVAPDAADQIIAQLTQHDSLTEIDCTEELQWDVWEDAWQTALTELSAALLSHQGQEQHIIFDIAKYIEQHYHEELSLQDMAGRFYVSREYISRKFKQQFGINLSDYVTQIRIEKARMLLLNPHLRIVHVAEMVGYQDEKYFSKVFKKVMGASPNAYRKRQSEL